MKHWFWLFGLIVAVIVLERLSKGATSPASNGPAPGMGTAGYGSDSNSFNASAGGTGAPGFGQPGSADTVEYDSGGGIFGVTGGW